MKIFVYSTYPFLSQPPFPPSQPLFNQSYFFGKSKVKHTGVDITCFFQDQKSSLTKHKKCFLKASYGTSQTSICSLLQKTLTAYS